MWRVQWPLHISPWVTWKGQSQGHSDFGWWEICMVLPAVYCHLNLDIAKDSLLAGGVFCCPSGLSCWFYSELHLYLSCFTLGWVLLLPLQHRRKPQPIQCLARRVVANANTWQWQFRMPLQILHGYPIGTCVDTYSLGGKLVCSTLHLQEASN